MLLYGYGSYGITIPADFRTSRLSLVDRGFVYAIVHPRGGMAKGYQWYLDGKLEKKTNTFKDFVAAGHYLVDKGYAAPDKVVAQGGSAGGLLMGAVVNMDPALFAGIIAAVPFVDVINTMSVITSYSIHYTKLYDIAPSNFLQVRTSASFMYISSFSFVVSTIIT